MDPERIMSLDSLQKALGYKFQSLQHLDHALTHSSYRHEARSQNVMDNERLEFLGDAVLNFVVSHHLYNLFSDLAEGKLAKLKSFLVSEPILASLAKQLELGSYLKLGKGETKSGGADRISNLGNAFEAVIGAIYLDGGIEPVRKFILEQLQDDLDKSGQDYFLRDYKSIFQEFVQARFNTIPVYTIVSESGPDHDKRFNVRVTVNHTEYGLGQGRSKKEAEQAAARIGCEHFKITRQF